MNYQSEVQTAMSIAEGVIKLALGGVTVVAKGVGKGAGRLIALLYAVLKDNRKTAGKTRIANLLKNGSTIKCFGLQDKKLPEFVEAAKKYGILYTIVKDRKAKDGITDVLFREEDVSRINRIIERHGFATVERDAELKVTKEPTKNMGAEFKATEQGETVQDSDVMSDKDIEDLINDISFEDLTQPQEDSKEVEAISGNDLTAEQMKKEFNLGHDKNPQEVLTHKSGDRSGPSSPTPSADEKGSKGRKSVRVEIKEIKEELDKGKAAKAAPAVGEMTKNTVKKGVPTK